MVDVSLFFLAIIGGLVSFLTPCSIATLPSFISYVIGQADSKKRALILSLLFSLGFILIFSIVAILFILISGFIQYTFWLKFISGIIIIALSVYLFFAKQVTRTEQVYKRPDRLEDIERELERGESEDIKNDIEEEDDSLLKYTGLFGAFMLGLSLGSSWIGCVTPIYLSIVLIATNQGEIVAAFILFLLYSLGIMIPYLIIGMLMKTVNNFLYVKLIKFGSKLQKIFAVVLLYIGIEMILSAFGIPGLLPFI